MKKRILPILFVFLMVFSSTAYAASPRVAQVVPGISFSGTTATCTVFIAAEQMTDDIDAVIKLWEGSRCIETWKRSSVGDLAFSGEASVTRGKTYKLTVDVRHFPPAAGYKSCPALGMTSEGDKEQLSCVQ